MNRKRRYSLVFSLLVFLAAVIAFFTFYSGGTNKNVPPIFRVIDVMAYTEEASSASVTFGGNTYEHVVDGDGVETDTPLTLSAAIAYANAQATSEDYPATVTMKADAAIDETLVVTGNNVKLELGSNVLSLAAGKQGSVIKVESGAHLTISDGVNFSDAAKRYYSVVDGLAVFDESSGSYSVIGGLITGGTGDSYGNGGGVYVASNGKLDFLSGNIVGNTATNGGGLYMANGSVVNISHSIATQTNPAIEGNTATNHGGGIFNYGGTLTLDGARVNNNTAAESGGGVWLNSDTSVAEISVINSAQLNYNTAKSGGALYALSGKFIGREFKAWHNSATDGEGGALYFASGCSVDLDNPRITEMGDIAFNSATKDGGGIYATGISLKIMCLDLRENKALGTGKGGGAAFINCHVSMTHVRIVGNEAYQGGGLYFSGTRNSADNSTDVSELYATTAWQNRTRVQSGPAGGGILVSNGAKVKTKGQTSIYGNTCYGEIPDGDGFMPLQGAGGGVAIVGNGSVFTLENEGSIKTNQAGYGAYGCGVYAVDCGEFIMNGGEISGHNRRAASGNYSDGGNGAVAVYGLTGQGGIVRINGGEIKNNGRGGIYLAVGQVLLYGGKITDNDEYGISSIGYAKQVVVSGAPVVKNNGANGRKNLLIDSLGSGLYNITCHMLEKGADIRFSANSNGGMPNLHLGSRFTTGYGGSNTASPGKYFTCEEDLGTYSLGLSDNVMLTQREVVLVEGRVKLEANGETTYHADAESAFLHVDDYDLTEENPAKVTLPEATDDDGTELVGETIEIHHGKHVVFDLNGRLVKYIAETGSVIALIVDISVSYGENSFYTSLTVVDSKPTAKHLYILESGTGKYNVNDDLPEEWESVKTLYGGVITGGKGYAGDRNTGIGGAIAAGDIGAGMASGAVVKIKGGTIAGNQAAHYGGGVAIGYNSKFEMTGGSIEGNYCQEDGGGVSIAGRSIVTITGGVITVNKAARFGGGIYATVKDMTIGGTAKIHHNTAGTNGGGIRCTVDDGTITGNAEIYGNTAPDGAGVFMSSSWPGGNTLTICGSAKIYSNEGNNNSAGGVSVNGGTLYLKDDAEIYGNTGRGVYLTGNFEMSGGKIYGHTANTYGAGVTLLNCTNAIISGGEIYDNTASGNGGGMYVSGGTFNLRGGGIHDNTASGNGGGIYVTATAGVMNVSGGIVKNNNANGAASNLYISSGKVLTIDDVMADGTDIGVTFDGGGIFTSGYTASGNTKRPSQLFSSDSAAYLVGLTDGEVAFGDAHVTVTFDGNVTDYMNVDEAFEYANTLNTTEEKQAVITLVKDAAAAAELVVQSGAVITLDLNGKILSAVSSTDFAILSVSGKLIIVDGNPTVSRAFTTPEALTVTGGIITHFTKEQLRFGHGAVVKDGGVLQMTKGTIIWNCASWGNEGSGVYVESGGTFTMTGGVIRNGFSKSAVYVAENGTFTLDGGTIKDNTVSGSYPVGAVKTSGTFNFVSGTVCSATGTLLIVDGGTATMAGGEIYNTGESNGSKGAVSVTGGKFAMSGGSIHGHSEKSITAGGVYVDNGAVFEMSGTAEIYGNRVGGSFGGFGGGVYVDDGGSFKMTGGTIRNNSAEGGSSKGGGVYVAENATLKLFGGTIAANSANSGGSGVYAASGSRVEASGIVTVSDNTSDNLYLASGVCVEVVGSLADDDNKAHIAVTLDPAHSSVFTQGYKSNNDNTAPSEFFVPDNSECGIRLTSDGEAELLKWFTVTFSVNNSDYGSVDEITITVFDGDAITVGTGNDANKITVGSATVTATSNEPDVMVYSFVEFTIPGNVTAINGNITITANFSAEAIAITHITVSDNRNGDYYALEKAELTVTVHYNDGDSRPVNSSRYTVKYPSGNGGVLFAGDNVLTVVLNSDSSKEATITINGVKKLTHDTDGWFTDKTVTYDGSEHSITIAPDKLPSGITVEYAGNGVTTAGTYTVTAKFTVDGNHEPIEDMTAQLVINKATFDPKGLFVNKTVTYDGNEHSITIDSAKVPNGITVEYEGNGVINAGTHTVTAKFTVNGNYNDVADMTAQLEIKKAKYDTTGWFTDITVTYDGNEHSITVDPEKLPDGVTVEYEGNGVTEVGTYTVTAKFTVDGNHEDIADLTAKITITAEADVNSPESGGSDWLVWLWLIIAVILILIIIIIIIVVCVKKKKKDEEEEELQNPDSGT